MERGEIKKAVMLDDRERNLFPLASHSLYCCSTALFCNK